MEPLITLDLLHILNQKLHVNERIKTDLSKNDVHFIPKIELYTVYFIPKIKFTLFKQLPKHVIIFLILQTFNRLPRLNRDGSGHIQVKYVNKCELLKNEIRFGPSLTVYEL
jgi:hypothetical protein